MIRKRLLRNCKQISLYVLVLRHQCRLQSEKELQKLETKGNIHLMMLYKRDNGKQ